MVALTASGPLPISGFPSAVTTLRPGSWFYARGDTKATERKMGLQHVFATVYRKLGIDAATTLMDPNGYPQYLLDRREPIPELI